MQQGAQKDLKESKRRESFSSALAIFFATLGSAVGLGNIWKFPYMAGENGGGAFVMIYLLCVLAVGIPIMLGEFYIGRKTHKNAVGAFKELKAKPGWTIIGYMGLAAAFLIMFFYSAVAGWVYSYVFKAIKGDFHNLSFMEVSEASKVVSAQFDSAVGGSLSPVIWQIIVMATVSIILILGIKKGIERITKTLLPVLFMLLTLCVVRALTLPKGVEGVRFLFQMDFSKVTASVILAALGLAFFKLSLGMGTMITYSSYFTSESRIINTSIRVALSDTFISIFAGLAIFPVVFSFGMEPAGGPGLLFNTIPLVFSKMPFGELLIIAFFFLTSIAATTAMISIVEVPVAYLIEEKGLSRLKAVLITSSAITVVGILTVHPASLLGSVKPFTLSFFDFFDYISSNILLPVGGLLIAIYVGYFVSDESFNTEVSNNGELKNGLVANLFRFLLKYVSPVLVLIVFLNLIGVLKI